jgi:chemosensory pili system protein ChpA (sensor histidine kinase/response regulator)
MADLPIVMITSRSTDQRRRLAEAAGVSLYLTKPCNDDELLDVVAMLLDRTARDAIQTGTCAEGALSQAI